MLIAYTMAHTDDAGRSLLTERLGDPELDADGVAALQQVIVDCGAHEAVETMITGYFDEAMAALAGPSVSAAGREGLRRWRRRPCTAAPDARVSSQSRGQHQRAGQHQRQVNRGSGQHQGEGRILGGSLLQHREDPLPGPGRATAKVA